MDTDEAFLMAEAEPILPRRPRPRLRYGTDGHVVLALSGGVSVNAILLEHRVPRRA